MCKSSVSHGVFEKCAEFGHVLCHGTDWCENYCSWQCCNDFFKCPPTDLEHFGLPTSDEMHDAGSRRADSGEQSKPATPGDPWAAVGCEAVECEQTSKPAPRTDSEVVPDELTEAAECELMSNRMCSQPTMMMAVAIMMILIGIMIIMNHGMLFLRTSRFTLDQN